MMIPMIGAMFAMFGCFWKRHSHRELAFHLAHGRAALTMTSCFLRTALNLVFLGIFTLFEAATLGAVVSFFNSTVRHCSPRSNLNVG